MTKIATLHDEAAIHYHRHMTEISGMGFDPKQLEHTSDDWGIVKAKVHYLYIQRNLSLYDVKDTLLRDLGFNATLAMYKRQLKSWHFQKNVSSRQKDDLVHSAEQCYKEHKDLPTSNLATGRVYDWHKVRRRDWEAGMRNEMWQKLKIRPRPESSDMLTMTVKGPTERLLVNIKEYSAAFLIASSTPSRGDIPPKQTHSTQTRAWQMPVLFQEAIRLVDQGSTELGHLKFNEAGIVLQAYLKDLPPTLLPQLLRVVIDQNWRICAGHRAVVFSFIRRLFVEKFGGGAPFSRFVTVLLDTDVDQLARDAIWQCVMDVFMNGRSFSPRDAEELQFRYFWALSDSGYSSSVAQFCHKAIKDTYSQSPNTGMVHLRRKWRYHLGIVLEQQKDFDQAKQMYQDAIHHEILHGDDAYYNNIHIETLRSLGGLHMHQGQWQLAAMWYKQAFHASLQLRGSGNARTLLCLDQLFVAYEKLGWLDDIKSLCTQYPVSCHHLNRFGTTMSFV